MPSRPLLLNLRQVHELIPAFALSTIRGWVAAGRLRSVKAGDTQQARRVVPYAWLVEDVKRLTGFDLPDPSDFSSSASRELSDQEIRRRGHRATVRIAELKRQIRARPAHRSNAVSS